MIRQLAILAVAAISLAVSTTAEAVTDEADMQMARTAILAMMSHQFNDKYVNADLPKPKWELDCESLIASYDEKWQGAVREFWNRYKLGMLPRGRLFSVQYPHLRDEMVLLFKVFYYAPNFTTLLDVAKWASTHTNEYQFIFALHAAMLHRPDTKWILMPPIYQFIPEFFFNTDVTKQVTVCKISLLTKETTVYPATCSVVANYTNWYITHTNDPETRLTYFTEDISFNNWYFYYNQRYPLWMSRNEYPEVTTGKEGEIYHYVHKFIAKRYYMERLSNGLGEVEDLDWEKPIMTGYYPYMTYPNGMHFPQRQEWSMVPAWFNEYLHKLKSYDSRIAEVVDSGFFMTKDGSFKSIDNKDGIKILGNLIEGNGDSLNGDYYGSFDSLGRSVLGFSPLPHDYYQVLPSALEQYATSLRDQAFYRLYEKVTNWFSRYQERLGPHTPQELAFDGVTIESASISEPQLVTYFDYVNTVINRPQLPPSPRDVEIQAYQYRLSHNPFTYNLIVSSVSDVKAGIRIFLGPKYNVYGKEISDNWKNFYEVDYFVKDLQKGENIIVRNSTDASWYTPDYETTESFGAVSGDDEKIEFYRRQFGLPSRMLLPKGKPEGMPFQFFIFINKFVENTDKTMEPIVGVRDNKPLGFPLDRPMLNYTLSNMYLMETIIVHKDAAA